MKKEVLKELTAKPGKEHHVSDFNPSFTADMSKQDAKEQLVQNIEKLSELQSMLYAQDRYSVLVIFQAMDAAGKDGTIKHVMSGINPQGCQVYSFKQPSAEELDHDYLWRINRFAPRTGTNRNLSTVPNMRCTDSQSASRNPVIQQATRNTKNGRYRQRLLETPLPAD